MEELMAQLNMADRELELTFVEYDDEMRKSGMSHWHCWIAEEDAVGSLDEGYGDTPTLALKHLIQELIEHQESFAYLKK